jgi:hypothetical protein
MEYSTPITARMCKSVLSDIVKVIVDYNLSRRNNKKNIDTGGFSLIYKGEPVPSEFYKISEE